MNSLKLPEISNTSQKLETIKICDFQSIANLNPNAEPCYWIHITC